MDNKTTDLPDLAALAAELDRLRADALAAAGLQNGERPGGEPRLLARLVANLDPDRCAQLLRASGEREWVALRLAAADFPLLHGLCGLLDTLPGESCPLAGMERLSGFVRRLHDEAERACRHSADLALAVFCGAQPLDERTFFILAEAARQELGGGETLACLEDGHLAVILPGARQIKARALAERILDHFAAALSQSLIPPPSDTAVRAGIACFSPDKHSEPAKAAQALREEALAALGTAPANQARVYQRDTRPMAERSVLVQAGEKHFLFFGSMEQS